MQPGRPLLSLSLVRIDNRLVRIVERFIPALYFFFVTEFADRGYK